MLGYHALQDEFNDRRLGVRSFGYTHVIKAGGIKSDGVSLGYVPHRSAIFSTILYNEPLLRISTHAIDVKSESDIHIQHFNQTP